MIFRRATLRRARRAAARPLRERRGVAARGGRRCRRGLDARRRGRVRGAVRRLPARRRRRSASGCSTSARRTRRHSRTASPPSTAPSSTAPRGSASRLHGTSGPVDVPGLIEDYGLIGDLQIDGARQPARVHRLALPAAVRLGRRVRRASGHPRERPLDAPARGGVPLDGTAVSRRHARPRDGARDAVRSRPAGRLHASARDEPRSRADRRGRAGARRDADGARAPLRLRVDRPLGSESRRHARRDRGAGRDVASHTGRARGSQLPNTCVVLGRRRATGCRSSYAGSRPTSRRPSRSTPRRRSRSTVSFWEEWAGALHVPRGVGRRGSPLAADAEGADVRADRGDRRRSDDVAPGGDRRRPQLGLPLLLAARCDADVARIRPRRAT